MSTHPQLEAVDAELDRQEAKWGIQQHPDGTGTWLKPMADSARMNCDAKAKAGTVTWKDILTEEVWEAFSEEDPERLKAELVQVAAVACQWHAAIERRQKRLEGLKELSQMTQEFGGYDEPPPNCT